MTGYQKFKGFTPAQYAKFNAAIKSLTGVNSYVNSYGNIAFEPEGHFRFTIYNYGTPSKPDYVIRKTNLDLLIHYQRTPNQWIVNCNVRLTSEDELISYLAKYVSKSGGKYLHEFIYYDEDSFPILYSARPARDWKKQVNK